MDTHVVIMAGGVGSRLWPLSTPERPKQFIDILGTGRTLIQMTVDRFAGIAAPERFWVVTGAAYVETVREQLPDIPPEQILAEPCARNTAPCIAYACSKIALRYPDANIVVTPADALVVGTEAFADTIRCALKFSAAGGRIVTVGIAPTRPETGYGYIKAVSQEEPAGPVKVEAFKEKPDLETARGYLADGNFFWNAGIFVWKAGTILRELRRYAPGIMSVMDELAPAMYTEREAEALQRLFPTCEKISIDYAVMERSDAVYVIPGRDLGWSDLGNWSAVLEHLPHSPEGNAGVGAAIVTDDTSGTIIHAAGCRKVVAVGLKDYIVAFKDGNLLICPVASEQDIKKY